MELKSATIAGRDVTPQRAQTETPGQAAGPAESPPALPVQAPTAGARLTLRRAGVLSKEVFTLSSGPSIIGRFDPETGPVDVDLGPLPEAVYISRHHAELWSDGSGQWFVKDLGSGNATFVCAAGERQFKKTAGDHPIKDGDEIAFGNARFEFRVC
jgi:pSer/pThr/pTyr-binding forkhead associated (FHA) protein